MRLDSPTTLKIAARKSDLARLQAVQVGLALQAAEPGLQIEYLFKASAGDQDATQPLWQAQSKGLFTQDFYEDLIQKKADIVVHSWKDLPTENRAGTAVMATLPREDSRDVLLISKAVRAKAPSQLRVLTSSPRRMYGVQHFLRGCLPWNVEDVSFIPVRGNVPTRIQKLLSGEGDILFVAKAALDRFLNPPPLPEFLAVAKTIRGLLDQCDFQVWPLSQCPTAAAQGALAVEVSTNNQPVIDILKKINHPETFFNVSEERDVLKGYGGGCHQKIGISCMSRPYGKIQWVVGETEKGQHLQIEHLTTAVQSWSRPRSPEQFFPQTTERERLFRRQARNQEHVSRDLKGRRHWWASRGLAVPGFCTPKDVDFLWAAGIKTWTGLARRGYWVHGTADSLGEREQPQIDLLAGKKLEWVKLTHQASEPANFPTVATYELEPLPHSSQDFKNKTHFFWMSGSQFQRALEIDPTICERGFHASGPGLTADVVQKGLKGSAQFQIFLNLERVLEQIEDL